MPTYRSKLCQYCLNKLLQSEEAELALDRHNVAIGMTHSGHCAHQWRLHIEGAEGFRGYA